MVENILDVLAPLSFASKLMGFSSFSINRIDFSVDTNRVDILFRIWFLVANFLLSFHLWEASQHFPLHKSDIVAKSMPIILDSNYVVTVSASIASIITRNKQSTLIKAICEIDEMLLEFNFRFNYKHQRRVLCFALFGIIIIDIVLIAQFYVTQVFYQLSSKSEFFAIFFAWNILSYSIFVLNFIAMTIAVKQRFMKINECLLNKEINSKDIQLLATIHQATVDVIGLINFVYSSFLMLFFGCVFCIFNIFLFGLARHYITDPREVFWYTAAYFKLNLYNVILILIIIRSTTTASGEGKRTMSLIYKIINASSDEKLNRRLINFCQQVLSSRMDFSCGLFNYDWSLCFKLISASAMYLVILIQFESTLPKRNVG